MSKSKGERLVCMGGYGCTALQGCTHRSPHTGRGVPLEMTCGCACTRHCSVSQHAGLTVVVGIMAWTGVNFRVADVGGLARESGKTPVFLSVTS